MFAGVGSGRARHGAGTKYLIAGNKNVLTALLLRPKTANSMCIPLLRVVETSHSHIASRFTLVRII